MVSSKSKPSSVLCQGTPSFWMLLGAFQSIIWIIFLPPMLKPYWSNFFGQFSQSNAEIILHLLIVPYYALYIITIALPPYLLQWEFFEQYKISKDPWPWLDERDEARKGFWKLTKITIALECFNLLVFFPCILYVKAITLPNNKLSFSDDDWPTFWECIFDLSSLALFHEFGFYWTHRIMHSPQLYKYHKIHHQYHQNNVLAAQYFHPIDFFISISGPALLAIEIVQPHSFTTFQFGLWLLTANFDDHLGYAFPWSPVRWFPHAASTDMHEFHHSNNVGCFASKLSLYDWMFGTDRMYVKLKRKK